MMYKTIKEMGFSKRTENVLKRSFIFDTDDLSSLTKLKLIRLRGVGEETYMEIIDICSKHGIKIK